MFSSALPHRRSPARRGTSALEVLVSFILLGGVLAMSTPLVVAHGRMLKAQRNYRLALDELSNQLDRLSALPSAELPTAVGQLTPSALTASRLSGATLRGRLAEADGDQRVTIEIWWDEPNRQAAPLRLTAWITPPPVATAEASSSEESP